MMPVENSLTDSDLFGSQIAKSLNVAALAAFAFDYCLTFPSEVEYVWGTKWEISRILFTLSRYLAFASASLTCYGNLAAVKCNGPVITLDVIYLATIIFAEGILVLRTYALWARSKRVLVFLLSLGVVFIVGGVVLPLEVRIVLPGNSAPSFQFYASLCAYRLSRSDSIQYNFLVVYEIILQSMCSWQRFRTYRNTRSRTLNTLYWDGVMYMSWIIVLSATNMVVVVAAPLAYVPALDTAQVALHSVLASRIFFNLRKCDKQLHSFEDQVSLEPVRFRAPSFADDTSQFTSQIEMVHVA